MISRARGLYRRLADSYVWIYCALVRCRLYFDRSPGFLARLANDRKLRPAMYRYLRSWRTVRNVGSRSTMVVGFDDVIERTILQSGTWEPHVRGALEQYLNEGDTFIDIGANIGFFSLVGAELVGEEGVVVAIEPSPRELLSLLQNIDLSHATNIVVHSCVAGNSDGNTQLYLSRFDNRGTSSIRAIARESTLVSMRRLDTMLAELSLVPDVIKIDVEGAEAFVIDGMEQTLHKHRPIVICELCEPFLREMGASVASVLERFESLGYECHEIKSNGDRTTVLSQDDHPEWSFDVVFTYG